MKNKSRIGEWICILYSLNFHKYCYCTEGVIHKMPEYTMWLKIHIMDELLRETKKRMLFRSDGMIESLYIIWSKADLDLVPKVINGNIGRQRWT